MEHVIRPTCSVLPLCASASSSFHPIPRGSYPSLYFLLGSTRRLRSPLFARSLIAHSWHSFWPVFRTPSKPRTTHRSLPTHTHIPETRPFNTIQHKASSVSVATTPAGIFRLTPQHCNRQTCTVLPYINKDVDRITFQDFMYDVFTVSLNWEGVILLLDGYEHKHKYRTVFYTLHIIPKTLINIIHHSKLKKQPYLTIPIISFPFKPN